MLANMNIVDFLEKTASSDPVPGDGSISALSAAAAASLVEMVANMTKGRKEYSGGRRIKEKDILSSIDL